MFWSAFPLKGCGGPERTGGFIFKQNCFLTEVPHLHVSISLHRLNWCDGHLGMGIHDPLMHNSVFSPKGLITWAFWLISMYNFVTYHQQQKNYICTQHVQNDRQYRWCGQSSFWFLSDYSSVLSFNRGLSSSSFW